jgi:hypothetical protein
MVPTMCNVSACHSLLAHSARCVRIFTIFHNMFLLTFIKLPNILLLPSIASNQFQYLTLVLSRIAVATFCSSNPCQNGGACSNIQGCTCTRGWAGLYCTDSKLLTTICYCLVIVSLPSVLSITVHVQMTTVSVSRASTMPRA